MFLKSLISHTKTAAKLAMSGLVLSGLVACGGAGSLISAPEVRSADTNDVVIIGDSIFALSGEIQDFLEADFNTTFRNYSVSGAQLIGGSLARNIPDQLDRALGDGAVKTLIMDGGGNDILIPVIVAFDPNDCKTSFFRRSLSSKCRGFIDNLAVVGADILEANANSGIQNIIYQGYYNTKFGFLGNLSRLKAAVAYGNTTIGGACANSPIPCQFIDPVSSIRNSDVKNDGIHPRASGSRKLANLIAPRLAPLL